MRIELNGEAVKMNLSAFTWGRRAAAEPELTLVHGTAPVAASASAAPAASAPAAAESKQAGQASPDEQDKQAGEADHVGPDPSMEVTVVPGVPRYHNARCILIRFMGDSDPLPLDIRADVPTDRTIQLAPDAIAPHIRLTIAELDGTPLDAPLETAVEAAGPEVDDTGDTAAVTGAEDDLASTDGVPSEPQDDASGDDERDGDDE